MEDDKDKPVKEVVPTEPEDTKVTPETPPVVTPPANANDDLREVVNGLSSKVEELTGIVTGVLASGGGQPDSTPVKKPWTHWGNKK